MPIMANEIQHVAGSMKVIGIMTIVFGILAIAMPWITGQSILVLIGILVLAAGVARMIWAFRASTLGKGTIAFLIGVLTLLAGIFILANPIFASGVLTIMLVVYLFADGLVELMAAFSLPSGMAGKGWLIVGGIASIVLGMLLWSGFPFAGVLAIGLFLGIKLLFAGMTILMVGSATKAVV